MTWTVTETVYRLNHSLGYDESSRDYLFDDEGMLVYHLLEHHRLDDVLNEMIGEVLTPQTFLEFLDSYFSQKCGYALADVYDDVTDAMIRRGMGPKAGEDYVLNGQVLATWSEEVDA